MSSKNLYRIGGIAAILSMLLDFRDVFFVDPNVGTRFDYYSYLLNNILIVLVAWALYHLYASVDRRFSLVAIILSLIGVVTLFINTAPFIDLPNGIFLTAWIFNHIIPILLFGILAYRHYQLGIPRILAMIGILYAVIQVIFYILYNLFPDLNLGLVDNLPVILSSVWLIWTGALLLSGKLQESPEGINIWGINKLVVYFSNTSGKHLQKPSASLKIGIGISVVSFIGVVALAYFFYPRQAEVVENDSKVIAAENADQIENTTQVENATQSEDTPQIKRLAQWHEVSSTIDDYFFNADGTLMGINSPYGVYLIDLDADSVTHLLPDQPYQHRLKAISPDGQFFVTEDNESERMRDQGQYQQRLYLWDVAQQKIIMQLEVGVDYETEESPYPYLDVIALTFLPDGSKINALIDVQDSSGDTIKSFMWNMPDGQLISNQAIDNNQLIKDLRGYENSDEVRFLPGNNQIVVSGYYPDEITKSLTVFSFPDGKLISKVLPMGDDLRISETGNTFVTVSRPGSSSEYTTWGIPDGNQISTFDVDDSQNIGFMVSFDSPYSYINSPTGDLFAGNPLSSGNITIVKNDGTAIKETIISGKVLTFSPKEDYIVVHSGSDLMFVNTSTGDVFKTIPTIQPAGGLAVHPVEDLMAFSQPDSIQIYQTSTRTLITSLSLKNENNSYQPPSISFSSDGKYLISRQYSEDYSSRTINTIWNTSDWSSVNEILTAHSRTASRENVILEILQGQPLLLETTEEGTLGFFDVKNSSVNEFGLTDPVYSDANFADVVDIKISPDQKYLAFYGSYGSYPGTPQFALFDLSKVASLSDLKSALASPVLSYPVEWVGEGSSGVIAFSIQSDFLAVYAIDGSIFVIDLKTLEVKWKINYGYENNYLLFTPDNNLLITDGQVYDMNSDSTSDENGEVVMGSPVIELPITGDFIGMSRDGELLISVSKDGVITYWEIP